MTDFPNKADFIADERPGKYEVTFSVVQRIERIKRKERQTERLRSELDVAGDRRSRMLAESEREGIVNRVLRMMGVRG